MVARLGTGPNGPWRLAKSLITLEDQVNKKYPTRKKTSDGSIGDEAHASRSSDHNPWVQGADGVDVVTAIDLTHDVPGGFDSYKFADMLVKNRDPRIKYIISNRRIVSSMTQPWVWRQYNGTSPHDHHVHISVKDNPALYDSTAMWRLDTLDNVPAPVKPRLVHPLISLGMTSKDVPYIHERLGMKPYEFFGNSSKAALEKYQQAKGLAVTGVVDAATWAMFEADKPYV